MTTGNAKGMRALAARSAHAKRPKRRWPWFLLVVVLVVAAGAAGSAFALTRSQSGRRQTDARCTTAQCASSSTTTTVTTLPPLAVASVTPAAGATNVPTNTTVAVHFSAALQAGGPTPTITPPVNGTWKQTSPTTMVFSPTAPFIPFTTYTVSVPGGSGGIQSVAGAGLSTTRTSSFKIADGSTLRVQQLLAELGYLPLAYSPPSAPAPQDMALPQPGTLQWRWQGMPSTLTDVWVQGQPNVITKGAVMMFETQNGLSVDGIPGPQVWTALLSDVAAHKGDTTLYAYVLVHKTLPQHLTMWVNGALQFPNVPVNTGVPGATTHDGTFPVFEHVRASDMKGCNVTGSCYNDPTVPWASYFEGGDALHGFVRAHYGYPQSNGCVEMTVAQAGKLWPYTPVGTLVTVVGPTPV